MVFRAKMKLLRRPFLRVDPFCRSLEAVKKAAFPAISSAFVTVNRLSAFSLCTEYHVPAFSDLYVSR